jgi:hypothetical protein
VLSRTVVSIVAAAMIAGKGQGAGFHCLLDPLFAWSVVDCFR